MIRTISEAVVAIGASPELSVLIKATIAVALGLAAVRIAKPTRASVRHLLLVSTFAAMVALPVAMLLVPAVRLEIPNAQAVSPVAGNAVIGDVRPVAASTNHSANTSIPPVTEPGWRLTSKQILISIWATGAALFFASLGIALGRLRSVRRGSLPWIEANASLRVLAAAAGIRRPVEVLLHNRILAPVTCGWLKPAILLPAEAREWNDSDVRRAFVHELEHIRRGDWMVQVLARGVCAAYWFHPLVWVAWRQLSLEAERACDDAVLLGADRADYAEQLVGLAQGLSHSVAPPALSMANRSDLSTRVSAILDTRQARGPAGLMSALSILTVAAFAVLAIAPLRVVAAAQVDDDVVSSQKLVETETSRLDRALLEAAQEGDVDDVTKLLNAGANINAKVEGDGSPLIVAARAGHLKTVELLLDRGADPDLAVPGDGNAIIMAAREGHEDVVKLLLDHRASIDAVVPGDENALIQASGAGQLSVVKLLVSRGADVNARVWVDSVGGKPNGEWRTPLSMARRSKEKAVIDFLLSAGARE
jgi:beta-lactamase regulating signal transducer with metallopeptidase domain